MVNSLCGARNTTQWVQTSGFRKHTAYATHIFHERPPSNPRVLSPLSEDRFLGMVNSLRGARSRTQWSRPAGCREHTAHATRIFHELPRELNPLSKDRFLVMVNSLREQQNAVDAPFVSYCTLLTPFPFPSNACTSSSFVHVSHILMVNSLREQQNAVDTPFLSYRTLVTPLPFPSNTCTSSSFVHVSHILVF